jgi:hypothetical protein
MRRTPDIVNMRKSSANLNAPSKPGASIVVHRRLVRPHGFGSPRGSAEPDGEYRSRFNFVWWFWLPRIHTQRPDSQNPLVIRIIWLCFAAGLDIWGDESRKVWPNVRMSEGADK